MVEFSFNRISLSTELLTFSAPVFSILAVDIVEAVEVVVDDGVVVADDVETFWLLIVVPSVDDSMIYIDSVELESKLLSVSLEVARRRLPKEWTPLQQRIWHKETVNYN